MAARAATALGDAVVVARAAAAMGGAADAAQGGKGVLAEPPSERAMRLTLRAWRGALPKMLCVMV